MRKLKSWLHRISVVVCCLMAAATDSLADGNSVLGFTYSTSGPVDYVVYANYHGRIGSATHAGTFEVLDLPAGAVVRKAYLYTELFLYRRGTIQSVNFDGHVMAPKFIGYSYRHSPGMYMYRNDVTAYVTGNGLYDYVMNPSNSYAATRITGASLFIVYEDPSISSEYQIEVHDGINLGNYHHPQHGPFFQPTNFTGFLVDGTPEPEADVGYLVRGMYHWYTAPGCAHIFNDTVIASNIVDFDLQFDRFDVSHLVCAGDTGAVANLAEYSQNLAWEMCVLRVRTSPAVTDTTPPEIDVVSHADGGVVATSPTTVRVAVRDDSGTAISSDPELTWDPATLPPETMGESSADYYLEEGPNPITVTATDEAGLFSTDSVTIVLDTIVPAVEITSPLAGEVFGAAAIALAADVIDANTCSVLSVPEGIEEDLGAGGGSVTGNVMLVEGVNVLSVTATDTAGHAGGDAVSVVLDTIPPTVTIASPAQGAVLGLAPGSLTIEVLDATATKVVFGGNSVSLDPGGGTAEGDVALVEGWNVVEVLVTDEAGNATTAILDLLLDLTAPVVAIGPPASGSIFGPGQSPIPVTVTVDDLSATTIESTPGGVEGALPQGGGVVPGSVTLVEGHNSIEVRATDEVGRIGTDSVAVILDTTPPEVAVTSFKAGDAVGGEIDFVATATDVDPGSGIAWVGLLVDGLLHESFDTAPYETLVDTAVLADGIHTLAVQANDGVGNLGSDSVAVLVDNTAPGVIFDELIGEQLDGLVVGGELTFQASAFDWGSGLARIDIDVAGDPPNLLDGSATYDPPQGAVTCESSDDTAQRSDGPAVLRARAIDDAGNQTTSSVTVIIDNTIPEWTLVQPAAGSVVSGTLEIVAAADDLHLDTLEVRVDGQVLGISESSPYNAEFDTTSRLDGPLTVMVVATDLAGNHSTCSVSVTVDNLSVAISPQTLNLKSKGKAKSITARMEGPNLGLLLPTEAHQIELRVPGGNVVPCTVGFSGDDVLADDDGDGMPELVVKFDRQLLIHSIHAALDAEMVDPKSVPVTLVAGGYPIGIDLLKIVGY